jgi:uncharacterized protein YyaL (SSP411 family)
MSRFRPAAARVPVLLAWLALAASAFGQVPGASREQVLQAIREGADYACRVLLDERGQSRCDYNLLEGAWHDYEPAWHTGQLILGLLEAYAVTRQEAYLQAAKKAGDWWIGLQIRDHPVLDGMVRAVHGDGVEHIIFSTVSDGTAGLFRLCEVTGERKYAEVPTRAGEWMLRHMYVPGEGVFYDAVDPRTGEVLKDRSLFRPGVGKPNLSDVARPNNEGSLFRDLFEYTGQERFKKVFVEVCDGLVAKQGPEGLWMDYLSNKKEKGIVHPRFNLWYAESLLEGYDLTGDRRYLEAARRTGRFYMGLQKADGTIYYENTLDGRSNQDSPCGSAVSFAGLVWLRLREAGAGEEFDAGAERSLRWVLRNRFSRGHPDRNLAGGFMEIRTDRKGDDLWITMRDIATSFGLRFLCAYYRVLSEDR